MKSIGFFNETLTTNWFLSKLVSNSMIYFKGKEETRRYSLYRPYIHPQVINIIKLTLQIKKLIKNVLDVGCGTGQSTIALLEIAEKVTGIDISEDMIAIAQKHERVKYMQAPAEDIPLPDSTFDTITVGLSFHWFDRSKFLPEAHRLLKPAGWLILYDNFFSGIMRENAEFKNWLTTEYTSKFPTPPRDSRSYEDKESSQYGFVFDKQKEYEEDITYNLDQLVGYITTMTNTIAVLKEGNIAFEEVVSWLVSSIKPFFKERNECTFLYRGWIKFLKKSD
jgi:ubiquinone/menaquinone biosynthesis C-methylase UbiE